VTAGQGKVVDVLIGSVPSTLATVVRWVICWLFPVINSMFVLFHFPEVSADQLAVQGAPCLNTALGGGPVATSWAADRRGCARSTKLKKANIVMFWR